MERAIRFFVLAVLVAVVLFVLLLNQRSDSNTLVVDEQTLITPEPESNPAAASGDPSAPQSVGQLSHPAPPENVRSATATRLADGDSFDIEWLDSGDADELRLFGINAPETTACFGNAAGDVLQVLTDGQELLVESLGRDDFGRMLANVWVGELFVNVEMVESGAALALSDGGAHADLIQQAQQSARELEIGLWAPGACGSGQAATLRVESIEANAPGQDHLNPNGEWITIVNDGDNGADLTDWSIRDESTRHRYYFPDRFILDASSSVQVFSGCGDDTANELYWCDGDPVWNNGGDTGFLVDPDGKFADSLSYSG